MTKLTDTERAAILAEEKFLVNVQADIHWLLEDKGFSQADLARSLNISEARVSQLFGENAENLTLRRVARIFHSLGEECEIQSSRLMELKFCHQQNWPINAQKTNGYLGNLVLAAMALQRKNMQWSETVVSNDNLEERKLHRSKANIAKSHKDRLIERNSTTITAFV